MEVRRNFQAFLELRLKERSDNSQTLRGRRGELQRRDEEHLEIARNIFLQEGYSEITISRLAQETGFSRPTLYDRFNSKEQLIVELGLQCERELLSFMTAASTFQGRPRERMAAVGEVLKHYADRYIDGLRISVFSSAEVVLERVTPDLRRQHDELELARFAILQDIIDDAIRQGDLTCPAGASAQTLTLTIIALTRGLAAALNGYAPLKQLEIANPVAGVIRSLRALYDGYGWRPLFSEWDYADIERRVRETIIVDLDRESTPEKLSPVTGGG